MSNIIDLSECHMGYRDYGGSDRKASIIYRGRNYMLKFPEHKEAVNILQTSSVNNVFSEYIGSHIMASLGIPTHETFIAVSDGVLAAVACLDFTGKNKRLQEFSWFMRSTYDSRQIGRIPTYAQLYDVMENHPILEKIYPQSIQRYWDTFVGDALIGNFDRHRGNWGYLVDENTCSIDLAPVYDCGSCLYPNLSEEQMPYILSSRDEIEKRIYEFPKAALGKNDNIKHPDKYGYYEMLSSNADRNCTDSLIAIAPNIDLDKINETIDSTPFISDVRKTFYKTMIRVRKELIIDRSLERLAELGVDIHRDNRRYG